MLINSPNISGSLTVTGNSVITGSLTVLGGINGAITGSATTASYVEYSNVANKPSLVSGSEQISFNGITDKPTLVSGSSQITYSGLTGIPSGIVSGSSQVSYPNLSNIPSGIVSGSSQVSFNGIVDKPTLVSGSAQIDFAGISNKPTLVSGSSQISFNGITDKPTLVSGSSQITYSDLTGIPSGIVSGSAQVAAFGYATTGSNTFIGNQTITGSILGSGSLTIEGCITATGQIVAQTINVQQVTSSIVYSCGSNIFGTSLSNTQQFTGSMFITGSNLNANVGSACFQGSICAPQLILGGADQGYVLDVKRTSTGDSTFDTVANFYKASTHNTGLLLRLKNTIVDLAANNITGGGGPTAGMSFSVSSGGVISTALTITPTGIACFACQVCAPVAIFSGCVGIGITSPAAKLDIIGPSAASSPYLSKAIQFAPSNFPTRTWSLNYDDGGTLGNGFNISAASTTILYLNANGNVGIGTTSPPVGLSIQGTTSDSVTIQLKQNAAGGRDYRITSRDDGSLRINDDTAGSERMRITSTGIACFACQVCAPAAIFSGCVGIGTSNPTEYKLQVEGTDSYTGIKVRNTNTASGVWGILDIRNNCNDGLQIGSVGNAGYSTSTNFYNSTYIESYNQRLNLRTYNDFGITMGTNSNVRMCILNTGEAVFACQVCAPVAIFSGCVGIGQTSPSFGLEVFSTSQAAITSNNTFAASLSLIFNRDNTGGTRNCFNLLVDQNAGYIRTLNDFPINFVTNGQDRLLISNTGIACFACDVCAPSIITNDIVTNNIRLNCSTGLQQIQSPRNISLNTTTYYDTTIGQAGMLIVNSGIDRVGVFVISAPGAGSNAISEIGDPSSYYSTTCNNASTVNFFFSGGSGNLIMQNCTGSTRSFSLTIIGTP